MTRTPWMQICLLAMAGCQSPQYATDPFLGRQRVPPPYTGTVPPPGAAQPYYQGAPPAGQTPNVMPSPGPTGATVPGGAYGVPQSSATHPKAVQPGEHEYMAGDTAIARRTPVIQAADGVVHLDSQVQTASAADAGDNRFAVRQASGTADDPLQASPDESIASAVPNRLQLPSGNRRLQDISPHQVARATEPAIEIIEPKYSATPADTLIRQLSNETDAPAASPTRQPHVQQPTEPVEITELAPVRRQATGPARVEATAAPSSAQQATEPSTQRMIGRSERYGYTTDYTRLRGRLEHLKSRDQWKLRYIPVDGETDDYGGSVIIANPDVLESFAPGDYVEVDGHLASNRTDTVSFAPPYTVQRAAPLSE
ncbi:MAG: hypothetical protein WDZ59_16610 [Pirellulales bacterium]